VRAQADRIAGEGEGVPHRNDHTPERPSWRCRICGAPWPCTHARNDLSARMDRVSLATHMWAQLDNAAADLPNGSPSELFDRFIHWTH
jgi:hypothetical protein